MFGKSEKEFFQNISNFREYCPIVGYAGFVAYIYIHLNESQSG